MFDGKILPYALLMPQLLVTIIFFYWPAAQAVWQSFLIQDAFGLSTEFVWFENYAVLFANPDYYRSMVTTLVFSTLVTVFSLSLSLLLAVQADKQIKGSGPTRPSDVALRGGPGHCRRALVFMFQPSLGLVAQAIRSLGFDWNPQLNANHAMALVVMAATWKQISYNFLFFLAGLQSIRRASSRRRRSTGRGRPPLLDRDLPLLSPTTFFLLVVNIVYVFFDTFGIIDSSPAAARPRAPRRWSTRSSPTAASAATSAVQRQSVILMVLVIGLTASSSATSSARSSTDGRAQELLLVLPHVVLALGILVVAFPVYVAFVASTWDPATISNGTMPLRPGPYFLENYRQTLFEGTARSSRSPVGLMMFNSLVMALTIAIGKIAISIISAFAIVYFRFPFRMTAFWVIFVTLMLPVEVRIYPTYKIVADLGLLDSYMGLTVPLIASATATLLFRQFFMTVPDELVEASKIDGAGPMQFFRDTLLPLSITSIAALFVIQFIYGWNQYLWPLLITTREGMQTIVIGIKKMIVTQDALTEWQIAMATAVLAMLPPVLVVILMQRLFVKGLVETEK